MLRSGRGVRGKSAAPKTELRASSKRPVWRAVQRRRGAVAVNAACAVRAGIRGTRANEQDVRLR